LKLDNFSQCPYLKDQKSRIEYFFATSVSAAEFNDKLESGWRRFGYFFFRPNCAVCFQCIPIRINTAAFVPNKQQRRVIRKNIRTRVQFSNLRYSDEIYEIYKEHSHDRFNQDTTKDHFVESFYTNAVPALQSEYYIDNQLAAVGFIDLSHIALSSVYFFYKSKYTAYSLGTLSVIRECALAHSMGRKYYYLGYYVQNNRRMQYKNKFHPHELYNWETDLWQENLLQSGLVEF
jgi:leucyl-tRNA---protein transferase